MCPLLSLAIAKAVKDGCFIPELTINSCSTSVFGRSRAGGAELLRSSYKKGHRRVLDFATRDTPLRAPFRRPLPCTRTGLSIRRRIAVELACEELGR
jgi:hypothetical protein